MKTISEEITKLGFDSKINDALQEEFIKSLKDPSFKALVNSLSLTDEQLMKYTTKLQNCVQENKHCKNCKNILECKNEVKGYLYTPEGIGKAIRFSYVSCPYQNDLTKKNKYQENIYYFDIPREIKEARIKNIYPGEEEREKVILWLDQYIDQYDSKKDSKGLYLYGNFGSGKTYLIAAMFNELANKNHKMAIIYWPEFLRDLKASFDDDFGEKFNYIKRVPLLLIDDIGAENLTPWARDEILGPILQYRMQEKLATFFTSNLSIEELEVHFSNTGYKTDQVKAKRIIERIKQLAEPIKMISKNKRQ